MTLAPGYTAVNCGSSHGSVYKSYLINLRVTREPVARLLPLLTCGRRIPYLFMWQNMMNIYFKKNRDNFFYKIQMTTKSSPNSQIVEKNFDI